MEVSPNELNNSFILTNLEIFDLMLMLMLIPEFKYSYNNNFDTISLSLAIFRRDTIKYKTTVFIEDQMIHEVSP